MAKILGISAYYHDSAAAITVDGLVIAAAQEERFTREKHTSVFPAESIRFCLKQANLSLADLDSVVFYDKPLLKFERLLETYYAFAPSGFLSFLKAIPIWFNDKLFLRNNIIKALKSIEEFNVKNTPVLFTEHHLSHAASAFFASSFEESAILTIDGVGEWCTSSISQGDKNTLHMKKEMYFPHSVGLLYSAVTFYLGFTVNSGEYKVMGLAPYGDLQSEQTLGYIEIIKGYLIDIKSDGSIFIDQRFFKYANGLKMTNDKKWASIFGFPRRESETEIAQHHCNLALAIQIVTEEIVLKMAKEAKRITNSNNLCLAGGVALNCVANGKLISSGIFENIFIQPASGDAGGALGAALATEYLYHHSKRNLIIPDGMNGAYLGPSFDKEEIEEIINKFHAVSKYIPETKLLNEEIARYISDGKIVGCFRGRMEFGPRALGNRSILADPRNAEMQKIINLKIKFREGFRPFAPAVTKEDCNKYFELDVISPYMDIVSKVRKEWLLELPDNYAQLSMMEKLYVPKSQFPAVTHLDNSARIQTVDSKTNFAFHSLLKSFEKISGFPILINTSFNVRGEPIVCSPEDAYRCFMATDMDILVLENYIFIKNEQPDSSNKKTWQQIFLKD